MALTLQQKSAYLLIFNATMIARSIGGKIASGKNLGDFKVRIFEEIEILTDKMDHGVLTEHEIIDSIDRITNEFGLIFGQAQKAINVILKFHFYLTNRNEQMKRVLHCPIDSIILESVRKNGLHTIKSGTRLTEVDKETYLAIQGALKRNTGCAIEFDTQWDEQHLRNNGLL